MIVGLVDIAELLAVPVAVGYGGSPVESIEIPVPLARYRGFRRAGR